jgi:hypothetical protein
MFASVQRPLQRHSALRLRDLLHHNDSAVHGVVSQVVGDSVYDLLQAPAAAATAADGVTVGLSGGSGDGATQAGAVREPLKLQDRCTSHSNMLYMCTCIITISPEHSS